MTHFATGLAAVLIIGLGIWRLGVWLNGGNKTIDRIGGGR